MSTRTLLLPLFLAGALLMGCEDKNTSNPPNPTDAQAEARKNAADAKAQADKAAADAKAQAEKAKAEAKAQSEKAEANKEANDAVKDQASKQISDLQTAIKNQKWTEADTLVKQLDSERDRLAPDQKVTFDNLKKQYNAAKP